jgi:hypothetical protein
MAANHVRFLEEGGLDFIAPADHSKFDSGGVALLAHPVVCPAGRCANGEVTLGLRLAPAWENGDCFKKILDVRKPGGKEAFSIGQWKSYLLVRIFAPPGGAAYREIGMPGILAAGKPIDVVISSGPRGTILMDAGGYVSGFHEVRLIQADTSLEGLALSLGNTPEVECPWSGTIYRLYLWGKELLASETVEDYLGDRSSSCDSAIAAFDFRPSAGETVPDASGAGNELTVPRHLVFDKSILRIPDMDRRMLPDVVANVVGFIPVGFSFSLWFRRPAGKRTIESAVLATLCCFGLSLLLETAQAWLPSRDSSLLDLAMNTLGAGLGSAGLLLRESRIRNVIT